MKQGILIVIFVILGAVIIAAGAWYVSSGALTSNNTGNGGVAISEVTTAPVVTTTIQTNSSTTSSMDNLKIVDTTVGTGATAENGDTVTVNYIGKLDDGTTFDSSFARNQPYSFVLGVQQVIKGWDLGVLGMKVGGTRELTIPSDMGYGPQGNRSIPPNATLHFVVTLLAVTSTAAGQ